jgi:hypothetical protein
MRVDEAGPSRSLIKNATKPIKIRARAQVAGLMPHLLRPQWYHEGLKRMTALMHMGGMTTAGDTLFGSINPDYEVAALQAVLE